MPTYTFDLLSDHFPAFISTLFQTWKHVKSATLHQLQDETYIAEITIRSELPDPKKPSSIEYFTSSVYITSTGGMYLKGADYFNEVYTWLHKIHQPT